MYNNKLSKEVNWKLFSLMGLIANASKHDGDSSSCYFIAMQELMLSTTLLLCTKGELLCFQEVRTPNPYTRLRNFSGQTTCVKICWIILGGSVVEFVIVGISTALFAIMECLMFKYTHCKTKLMSVNKESWSKITVYVRQIFFFKSAVRRTDCFD